MTDNLANKISDLKKLADERKQLIVSRTPGGTGKLSSSPTRQNTASASASAPLLERPASRVEIHSLELELEERVRLVLDSSNFVRNPNEFGLEFSYQPHKEAMMLTRERMLNDLHATLQDLEHEPWLDSYVKCECLKQTCDEVSSRFADMLGVNSTELGSVARKLRLTYKQSFEQMAVSWKNLRKQFTSNETELSNLKKQIAVLTRRLENKEEEISSRFDKEIARISREYQEEKERDQAQLAQAELKMDQMSDTLKYLNGIFRAMQNDTASLKTADLHTLVAKLTKENDDLKKENAQFDTIKTQLFNALTKIKTLEGTVRSNNDEIQRLNLQLQRREEAINHLMEKDTIRTAEIEKLQRISKMKDEEILAMDMKDVATSVLCIKCKKSLDDMTNIRSTLMADQAQNPAQRLQCENYRILLPNLRNRKPHRTTPWIRSVIRCILLSKVKEDLSLHFLKGDAMTFPAFTYAWFRRNSDGLTGTALTKLLVLSDEDRWGLYYGIKALHKEDSEASFFWSLLDETFGQDGLRFALYCLSVILSLGGKALWRQFGSAMTHGSSINTKLEDDSSVRANIWIDIATAKEGVAMILTKALAPHLNDALDSIDALKVKPEDILPPNPANNNTTSGVAASPTNQSNEYSSTSSVRIVHEEPTHISLFTWLRIMLQQFHADQIHRNAAIRLMFETASVGALTPANHNDGGNGRGGASGTSGTNSTHVEYPQFQSICQTLFPYLSICEIGNLYARCHYAGKRRVTAEVFHYQADIHGFFALSLKLNTLPLLKQLNLEEEIAALASSEEGKNDGGEGISSIIPSTSSAGTVHSMPMVNGAFSSTPGARGGGANNAMNLNTSDEPHYTKRSLFVIRSKLATVVHRRFAGLMPGLKYMMKYLPERWKATLIDCMELVTTSLNDTFNKLKELNKQFQTPPSAQGGSRGGEKETTNKGANTSSPSSLDRFLFLDGIQPYLHYRRLLSLVIFLQSCNENPYLPTEIFTAVVIKNNKQNIEKAVLRIEKIMESLENVIFSPSDLDYVNLPQRILHKYDRFQTTRHVLVVRRIQAVFKKFLSKEVAIPRSVRMVMAAGYLTNSVHQEHLFQPTTEVVEGGLVTTTPGVKKGGFYSAPLKHREVYHEPWWAQVHIANIYLFKISYDMKASQLGKEGINLPQAISAYFYCVWGSMDVAERSIQDLFVAIKSYRFNMPRLRLFAAFVGDGRDLEGDNVEEVFATSEAVSIYYSLLFAIHRQLAKKREYMLRLASKSSGKDHTKMQKSGNSYTIIETLFPSTENTFQRNDKREIWLMDADLLTQAAKVWAGQQSWLKGQIGLFSDLPEKLRPDIQNRVDVDDFLWLMMMQWAKLEVFHVKKCLARGSLIEKSIFGSGAAPTPATPSNANNPPPSGDPGTPQNMLMMKEGFLSRRLSVLPLSNLKSIVESIYRPEDGDDLADIQHYATAFIKSIRSRRAVLPQPVESTSSSTVALSNETIQRKLNNIRNLDRQFGSELQKLLKDCVLWDTNLAFVDSPAQPAVSASDRPTSSTATREGSISPTKKRTSSVSKASFLGRTSLFNLAGVTIDENAVNASSTPLVLGEGEKFKPSMSERGSLGGVGAEAMTVHYSAASIKLSHYADNTIIGNGVFSEMMFVMSKAAFSSYQGPINVFLDKLSNDARLGKDSDVKSRIQAIRLHLLQVGEFFQLHDLSTNHQQTISTKIFNFELLGAVEDLKDTYIERTRYMKLANDSMQKLQSLFASVSDLAVLTKQEFPRDTWQKGAKIHLERAFVYNIATKNALL